MQSRKMGRNCKVVPPDDVRVLDPLLELSAVTQGPGVEFPFLSFWPKMKN